MFFSPFSIAITSLGEERANLSAFHTFVRFVLVWFCRFPLPFGVVCDCVTPWTFLLPFYALIQRWKSLFQNLSDERVNCYIFLSILECLD